MLLTVREIYRFDEFELDLRKRCLERNQRPVPVSPKAFDVLVVLVTNAGGVVSKELLLSKVWPGSFVEEGNLAQHISALRKAFGDRAGYIVTVPGSGYQFTAVVTSVASESTVEQSSVSNGSAAMTTQILRERATVVIDEHFAAPRSRPLSVIAGFLGAVAILVTVIGGWFGWRALHHASYGHAVAVLAQLDNETGDAEFDHILNKVLQFDLQQSPYFSVVSENRARHTLVSMRQSSDEPITQGLARDICERLNGQITLAPTIAKLGDHYLLSLQSNDCGDNHMLGEAHEEVASKSGVLAAFSRLTSKMRRDAGETASSLHQFNKPLYDEPTSSLEALKAYSEATRIGDSGNFASSIALYKHAIELDPNFALAYADMSSMFYNINDSVNDKAAVTRAYQLRDTVNQRERFYIIYRYNQSVTGDLEAMLEACRQWVAMYPEDNIPLSNVVNFETWTGQYSTAAAYADRLIALQDRQNIHNGIAYEIAARAYHHANMPDKVRAIYAAAQQASVVTQGMTGVMLEFAAENNDETEVEHLIAESRNTPAEAHVLQEAALAALADGQVKLSDKRFAEATKAAQRDKITDSLADLDDYHARMLAEMGYIQKASALLASITTIDTSLDRAFAEAAVGQTQRALDEAAKAQADAPQDTLMNTEYVPSVRALVALQHGEPAAAVQMLKASAAYELRDPTVPYLRGKAYLAAHEAGDAVREFSKLAMHPFLADPPAVLIALSNLQLARAYAMAGDKASSRREYQAFFADWKNADPDVPELIRAHEEYAKI